MLGQVRETALLKLHMADRLSAEIKNLQFGLVLSDGWSNKPFQVVSPKYFRCFSGASMNWMRSLPTRQPNKGE